MNLFGIIFFIFLATRLSIKWILVQRHIQHILLHRAQVPHEFSDKISLEAHHKASDYTQGKVKADWVEIVLGSIFLLLWTVLGGLQFLDHWWRGFEFAEMWTGTLFILSTLVIMSLLDLPMSIYRTFKLEQVFGFNKINAKMFVVDLIKNTVISFIIGTPILIFALWLIENSGHYWWVYVWLTWLSFSLFMLWAYPAFIAPLYNKFRPLENQELKTRIEKLLARNGFKSQGIFVMDGSTRSTHGNAYFTGLGTNKRIVFFDTLIDELSYDEIEAVLAHELGHFKCNHIVKRMTILSTISLIGLAILNWVINKSWFYEGLGVTQMSDYMGLLLFIIISPVFTFLLQPMFAFISRRHEFEADDFAAGQAQTKNLISALVNLYRENANTLTPDPLYSAFHDSHPPAPIRIAYLKSKLA